MKSISSIFLISMIIFIGCSKNSTESQDNDEIKSGTIKLKSGQGFDFSTERLIKIRSESDVNLIDLYISISQDPSEGGELPKPFKFEVIGSPVGLSYVDPYYGGIYYIVIPDNNMPAIKAIVEDHLDNITEISPSGFVLFVDKINTGFVYAVKNQDSKYSLFKISQIDTLSDTTNVLIDWRYQPNGSNKFE